VRQALNSFTKPWGPFVRGIVAREALPTWERMWDDFVQEEIRLASEASGQRQQQHNRLVRVRRILLFGKRARRRPTGVVGKVPRLGASLKGVEEQRASGQGSQGRDMSKVKCFVCKKFGHYAGQCPNRKKKKGGTAGYNRGDRLSDSVSEGMCFSCVLQFG
jgi:hypothetical protein